MEPHIILFVSTCPLSNYCTKLIIGFDYPDLDTLFTEQHCASLPLMIYILFTTYLQMNKMALMFLKILVHRNQIMFKSTTQLASEASPAAAL